MFSFSAPFGSTVGTVAALANATLSGSAGLSVGGNAAEGLYDDSTLLADAGKQVTGRFPATTYNSASVVQLGMLMMIPLFLEHYVTRGVLFATSEILRMFGSFSFLFYPFAMQTKSSNFGFAVTYGKAGYVATGRGYAIDTVSVVAMYGHYGASHIYFGFKLGVLLMCYEFWKAETKSFLDTWGQWSVCISLCLSPWIFNPQALQISSLTTSWEEFLKWLYAIGDPLDVGQGSWLRWSTFRLKSFRAVGRRYQSQLLMRGAVAKSMIILACVQGLALTNTGSLMWRLLLIGLSVGLLLGLSVLAMLAVTTLEGIMLHLGRYHFLPMLTTALLVCFYGGAVAALLILEHGGLDGLYNFRQQVNVWYLLLASMVVHVFIVEALAAIQIRWHDPGDAAAVSLGLLPKKPPAAGSRRDRLYSCLRRPLMHYCNFWLRIMDQTIALTIFGVLLFLSILPLSTFQMRILFNSSFSGIIEKKIHRQNVLSDLYTPGFFHQVAADHTEKPTANVARRAVRRASLALAGAGGKIGAGAGKIGGAVRRASLGGRPPGAAGAAGGKGRTPPVIDCAAIAAAATAAHEKELSAEQKGVRV